MYNPDLLPAFCADTERCFFGNAPKLWQLNEAYGKGTSAMWLTAQLSALNDASGARTKMDERQLYDCAVFLAREADALKITELMVFFWGMRTAKYGKFFGSVDADTIIRSYRDFLTDRATAIDRKEMRDMELQRDAWAKTAVTYEEYLQLRERGVI